MEKLPDVTTASETNDVEVGLQPQETPENTAPIRQWFVAFVGHNTEKICRDRLKKLGYDAFVASREEVHRWQNGKRKKVERVVITNIVFVHCTEQERRFLVNFPFIKYYLVNRAGQRNEYGGRPMAVIPDKQMDKLRFMLGKSERPVLYTASDFSLGDHVRLTGWGLEGFEGQVVRIPGGKGRYVGIRIDYLGCAYMEVDPDCLEIIK